MFVLTAAILRGTVSVICMIALTGCVFQLPVYRIRRTASPSPAPSPTPLGNSFYISPTGDDVNPGTLALPWKTSSKVSSMSFGSGDSILFEGGEVFGPVILSEDESGTSSAPVKLGSYGGGRATLNGGAASEGLLIYNTGSIEVDNLNVVGDGAGVNPKGGVFAFVDKGGDVKLPHLKFSNMDISGFHNGLMIGGGNGASGFDDVEIFEVDAHGNVDNGIITYGAANYSHTAVHVHDSRAYENSGTGGYKGSGIVLGHVNGGTIEYCVAYGNGAAGNGGVGLWTYESNNIVIQFSESYDNRTSANHDGGGFDLDGGVTNSVMQYNHSHGNDGAGYLLVQFSGASPVLSGNTIRYNLSENDGRKNSFGGILVGNFGSGVENSEIYNNTVYMDSDGASGSPAPVVFLTATDGIHLRNNLFYAADGLNLVTIFGTQTGIQFQGNHYFSTGGSFVISWGGTGYGSLADFRAGTGMESLGGEDVGSSGDPIVGLFYEPGAGSPLIDAGIDLSAEFGIEPGSRDYSGGVVPQGLFPDVGALESAGD